MKLHSDGIVDGIIADKFGSKGEKFTKNGMPNYSLPLDISDIPKGTKTFALIMEDRDAIPVCGFSWIHWTAANILKSSLKENASVLDKNIIQGVNSYHSKVCDMTVKEATGYGGPDPPNGTHEYELHVYALNTMLDLKDGFFMNDLCKAMRGHILAEAVLYGMYSPKE